MPEYVNINRSKKYDDFIQKLAVDKLPGNSQSIFPTIRELLCFAALLGYSQNNKVPLDQQFGTEDISYQQFERGTYSQELIHLLAVADTKDPEILKEGRHGECVKIFEEYANGGIELLLEAAKIHTAGYDNPERAILDLLSEHGYLETVKTEIDLQGVHF